MSKSLHINYSILSLWFYKGKSNWIDMNSLDSITRGRGKKWGDREFEALKSLHRKLKEVEIESNKCYGSWSEHCESVKKLIEKNGNKINFFINENKIMTWLLMWLNRSITKINID